VLPITSDMIDALIKRVSVTYKCYEMYAHRGKKVQLLMFWDPSRNARHLINYRHCLPSLPNRHYISTTMHLFRIFCESAIIRFVKWNKGKYFTLKQLIVPLFAFWERKLPRFIISLQANNLTSLSPYAADLTSDR
jgi:hypothetical protein